MRVRPVGVGWGDPERVVENLDRDEVPVIAVVVIRLGLARLGHRPNDLQVSGAPNIEVFGSRPPVERLLIMRPRLLPILRVTPRPPEIAERFLRFGPNPVAVFGPPSPADERFEQSLRRFVFSGVRSFRRPLRPP